MFLFSIFRSGTAPTEIYTLSLHDALPICADAGQARLTVIVDADEGTVEMAMRKLLKVSGVRGATPSAADRKSTRLNSSHVEISYAVFCLKKKITGDIDVPMRLLVCPTVQA